jgi:quinol monooxygenase YgiN
MNDQISWHVQLAVKPGQLDNFRALTTEMVESTMQEAGVLNYERFISADGNFVHVYERYTNSPTAVAHLQRFTNNFRNRFMMMVERTHFIVFGNPSDELRGLLDQFGATYLTPFGDLK